MNIKRRDAIKKLLLENGEVTLLELSKIFPECSSMTLRRDLIYFESEGLVRRTRGGCVALKQLSSAVEDVFSLRALENVDNKKIIAGKALKYLQSGRSVFLDSGTTLVFFAREIPDNYYNFITAGPSVAIELARKLNPYITITGGQINRNTLSISGLHSIDFIRSVNIDIAFMATSAFSAESGFTSGVYAECELKREVIERSKQVVMLMDSTKINRNMPYTFAKLDHIDVLVSDGELPEDILSLAEKCGVDVV